jgi:CRISPR-associated protein Csd1
MQRFAERPYATWLTIETALTPYRTRLQARRPAFLHSTQTEIDEVMSRFATEDFISDQRLSGEFLLSYHCQRTELRVKVGGGSTETGDEDDDAEAET